jgi:hypothetical protein
MSNARIVQYTAKPIIRNGGGRSGNSAKGNKGPVKTTLIGSRSVETAFFHVTGDPVPRKDSFLAGNSRTSDPNSELVMNSKANPQMRKRATNLVLDPFIVV